MWRNCSCGFIEQSLTRLEKRKEPETTEGSKVEELVDSEESTGGIQWVQNNQTPKKVKPDQGGGRARVEAVYPAVLKETKIASRGIP